MFPHILVSYQFPFTARMRVECNGDKYPFLSRWLRVILEPVASFGTIFLRRSRKQNRDIPNETPSQRKGRKKEKKGTGR
jgi:hypothetical protein